MSKDNTRPSRRDLLKLAGTAAPAVAIGAMAANGAEAAPADGTGDHGADKGLQDTAHIRRYYELARF